VDDTRRAAWEALSQRHFDMIVIGGGVIGAGVARDAALRGLSVALLEKEDFGAGTSSRPTRLIHGGLRYLEMLDFKLVREDLKEREILLRTAPHLVRPLPFLVPYYERSRLYAAKLKAGMMLYDALSYDKSLPRHRVLSRAQALAAEPALSPDGLSGGALYYDAQVELTERLCVENALAAAEHGATLITHATVVDLLRQNGDVVGVTARDNLEGGVYTVRGSVTINASGPWLDDLVGKATPGKTLLRRTKGVHLATPPASTNALVLFAGRDNRLFFVVPWMGLSWVGTTDTDFTGDPATARATPEDVAYLLDAVRRYVPGGHWDTVYYTQAGVRSLIKVEGVAESAVSRRHQIYDHARDGAGGLLSLVGGKLTAYRGIAADLVDAACARLGRKLPCRTATLPLPGGRLGNVEAIVAGRIEPGASAAGLSPATVRHLASVYGSRYGRVVALCAQDPSLARPLCAHGPTVLGEVVVAVRDEMALTLSDVLLRRLGVAFRTCRGLDCAPAVAAQMAGLLGWDAARTSAEVAAYEQQVHLGDPPPSPEGV